MQLVAMGLRRRGLVVAAVVAGVLGAAGAARAATFTVNSTADQALATSTSTSCATASGACTLRAAVQAADNLGGANTITLPEGTYKLTIASTGANDPSTGDLDVTSGDSLTIAGAGAGSTIIDANEIDRAFAVQSGAGLSLSGVTITNGFANGTSTSPYDGGAIYTDGTLAVTDSVLDKDDAEQGGDIYADTGSTSVTVTGSTLSHSFVGSTGNDHGGAIDLEGGSLTVSGTSFAADDSYDDGGAIYQDSGPVAITGSTFANDATGNGGAIFDNSGALTISQSSFSGDQASNGGGGALLLDQASGDVTISGTAFSGNSVADRDFGGAIALEAVSGVTLSVSGSQFSGNSSYEGGAIYDDGGALSVTSSHFTANNSEYGGGVYLDAGAGTASIDHSTLDQNSANYEDGGGLYVNSTATTTVSDTTISYNQAGFGGGVYFDTTVPVQLTNDTIADNLAGSPEPASCNGSCGGGIYTASDAAGIVNTIVADNPGGDCFQAAGATVDQGHNLDSDGSCFPVSDGAAGDLTGVDPLLGPLQDNGGPAPTQALLPGSPAIDAGDDSACPSTDERGVPRPQGPHCDIGAFEVAAARLSLAKGAPATATVSIPFDYTVTASDGGPGPSSSTTVVDQLPANTTLYGASASQGNCSSSGSPAQVICDLGTVNDGASATVTLVVAVTKTGSATNTATASNGEGSSASASATTQINSPPVPASTATKPSATTGGHQKKGTHGEKLFGNVTPGGQTAAYFFQSGRSRRYGQATTVRFTGTATASVSASISGLKRGATYHYRLVAINDSGISYGDDHTFRIHKPKKKKKKK